MTEDPKQRMIIIEILTKIRPESVAMKLVRTVGDRNYSLLRLFILQLVRGRATRGAGIQIETRHGELFFPFALKGIVQSFLGTDRNVPFDIFVILESAKRFQRKM